MGVGAFDFICDNINVDKKDKYQVYVQFMDNKYENKIEGYDSYIYSNDYETAVLDLINAMYKSGFTTLCASDIRSCLKNKSFNHYKYIINEPLTSKLLNKILNEFDMKNKECILICHGNNEIAYMEFEILWEALKNTKTTIWWYAYITNGIKSKDRWLSLYIEK